MSKSGRLHQLPSAIATDLLKQSNKALCGMVPVSLPCPVTHNVCTVELPKLVPQNAQFSEILTRALEGNGEGGSTSQINW